MKQELGSDLCIILTNRHVTRNMWPDFVKSHFTEDHRYNGWFLESTTGDNIKQLLELKSIKGLLDQGGGSIFIKENLPIQVCTFSLQDYRGRVSKEASPAGMVIVWKDAANRWDTFKKNLYINIIVIVHRV